MNDLDAIEADLARHARAIGPSGEKAWEAAQLARHVRPLADEVRRQRQTIDQLINFRNATVAERDALVERLRAVRMLAMRREQWSGGTVDADALLAALGEPLPAETRPPVVFNVAEGNA